MVPPRPKMPPAKSQMATLSWIVSTADRSRTLPSTQITNKFRRQPRRATRMTNEVPTTDNQFGNHSWSKKLEEETLLSASPQAWKNSLVKFRISTAEEFPKKDSTAFEILWAGLGYSWRNRFPHPWMTNKQRTHQNIRKENWCHLSGLQFVSSWNHPCFTIALHNV